MRSLNWFRQAHCLPFPIFELSQLVHRTFCIQLFGSTLFGHWCGNEMLITLKPITTLTFDLVCGLGLACQQLDVTSKNFRIISPHLEDLIYFQRDSFKY